MKNKSFIPLLGFILLLGVTSCTEPIEVNPNYNPETKEVKTHFVLNISNLNGPATKQTAGATQANTNQTFRGITDAYLMTKAAGDENDGRIMNKDVNADKLFDLATVIGSGEINADQTHRVLEMSLPLKTNQLLFYGRAPKVMPDPAPTGVTVDEYFGRLETYNVSATQGDVKFSVSKRLKDDQISLYVAVEKVLAAALSTVMHTNLMEAPDISATDGPEGYGNYDGTGDGKPYKFAFPKKNDQGEIILNYPATGLRWSSYSTQNSQGKSPLSPTKDMYPLEVKLKDLYDQMVTVNSTAGELRAASGEAILRIVKDMWAVINEIRCASPTCEEETVAKFLANKIHLTLKQYFTLIVFNDGSIGGGDAGYVAPNAEVVEAIKKSFAWMDNTYKPSDTQVDMCASMYTGSSINIFKSFPQYFKLPRGATHMKVDMVASTDGGSAHEDAYFEYPSVFNTEGMGTPMVTNDQFNENSYYYPAELLYFGNSPIRVSNLDRTDAQYPQGSGKSATKDHWGDDENQLWTDGQFSIGHVLSSTRSVAMQYDINYGVAMLQTQVAYGATTLKDNNSHIHPGETDKTITPTGTSFKLTGIIIGGQSKHVGWDFLPLKVDYTPISSQVTTPNYEEGFIYDSYVTEDQQVIPSSGSSEPVYTLVFDNYIGTMNISGANEGFYTDGSQLDVHVALEFYNNSEDFYGNENLIRKGGYFYLIGKLKISDIQGANPSADAPEWRTDDYVTPPYRQYTQDSNNKWTCKSEVPRVFIQDYVTKVTFRFGEESLKHAYLTVPDLRSSSLSLGLNVDMKWETGINFNNVILGD